MQNYHYLYKNILIGKEVREHIKVDDRYDSKSFQIVLFLYLIYYEFELK